VATRPRAKRSQIRSKPGVQTRPGNQTEPEARADLGRAAVSVFAVNERLNQMLIEHLDPAAWRAKTSGNVRTIAAIFTHVHNVRTKWVRLTAPHLKVPRQLDRVRCTPQQASKGLAESAARCEEMLAEALGEGRIGKFLRDGWARPWPVGPEMLCYMVAHDASSRAGVPAGAPAWFQTARRADECDVELGAAVKEAGN
jgi:hypothetical protein